MREIKIKCAFFLPHRNIWNTQIYQYYLMPRRKCRITYIYTPYKPSQNTPAGNNQQAVIVSLNYEDCD